MSEKIIVLICGVLSGSFTLTICLTLRCQEDEFTAGFGIFCMAWDVLFLIILPPALYITVSSYNKLSEEELSSVLMKCPGQS